MIAVLGDAIDCYMNHLNPKSISGKGLFDNAEKWFFNENEEWLFSFVNICQTIGLDPNYLRRGLLAAKTAALGRQPPARIYRFEPRQRPPSAEAHVCAECAAKRRPHPLPGEVHHADFRQA